jgi:hypothetical protein
MQIKYEDDSSAVFNFPVYGASRLTESLSCTASVTAISIITDTMYYSDIGLYAKNSEKVNSANYSVRLEYTKISLEPGTPKPPEEGKDGEAIG